MNLLYYGMPFAFYYDPTYFLILIGIMLSLMASARVKSTFATYSRVHSYSGMTGAMACERILRDAGIYDVSVEHISGSLTDHFDPRNHVIRLSDSVYGSTSIAAIGVAAHEAGHAIQHQTSYAPLKIRDALVPVANFGAKLSWPMIFLGLILSWLRPLITVGIVLFCAVVLFQIITLPVEFNASNRAMTILSSSGILNTEESGKAKKVLKAAALTYVAAATASILQLLRLILLFGGRNRGDD